MVIHIVKGHVYHNQVWYVYVKPKVQLSGNLVV